MAPSIIVDITHLRHSVSGPLAAAHIRFCVDPFERSCPTHAPEEVMRFRPTLPQLVCAIIGVGLHFGPIFIDNVDLLDADMRVWVRPKYLPSLAFIVLPHPE